MSLPRRWLRACVTSLCCLSGGLSGLPAALAQALPPLQITPEQTLRHPVSAESRFADTGWQGIEQATQALAERRIGSFEGVPTGWQDRPVRIHHRSYVHRQEQRGAVLIVPGFTEGLTLYQEVIHDLVVNGYSVYIHDHRGQGFSTRLLTGAEQADQADQADKGHIDRFDHLVADLETFVAHVRQQRASDPLRAHRPMFVLAHSMGGAVVALHLARRGADTPFAAAALVTPMFEPTVAPRASTRWLDRGLRSWCHAGAFGLPWGVPLLSQARPRGGGFEADRAAFLAMKDPASHPQTHSVVRHRLRWDNRSARCEGPDCGHVDARVAGATFQWVDQACAAADQARGPGAARIDVPVWLLQGGEDSVVEPEAQVQFCESVNARRASGSTGRCVGWRLADARHGVLVEVDRIRQPALASLLSFFDEVARRGH